MEENSQTPKELLKEARATLEQELVPKQKETLSKLSVKSEEESLGEELKKAIDLAFEERLPSDPEEIDARLGNLDARYVQARLRRQPMYTDLNVREVGDYIVRKKEISDNLVSIEVFDKKAEKFTDNEEYHPETFYKYKHHLVIDRRTNLAADLIDLNAGKDTYLSLSRSHDSGYLPQENVTLIYNSRASGTQEASSTHESGHSHLSLASLSFRELVVDRANRKENTTQFSDKDVASFVTEERNAWAFALASVRRYKELGVDLTEIINARIPDESLKTYDQSMQRPEFKFSKRKN